MRRQFKNVGLRKQPSCIEVTEREPTDSERQRTHPTPDRRRTPPPMSAGDSLFRTLDLSLSRRFSREFWRISPTEQILNLTNRVNVLNVSENFFTPGRPINVGDSRQIQIGVDISFER